MIRTCGGGGETHFTLAAGMRFDPCAVATEQFSETMRGVARNSLDVLVSRARVSGEKTVIAECAVKRPSWGVLASAVSSRTEVMSYLSWR
jgi:hypothetical protein